MIFGKNKTKKLRKRPFWGTQLQQLQWKKYLLIITVMSFLGALLFGGNRIYRKTLGSPTYTISKVVFAPESVNALRSIELYTAISDNLQGKNYFWTKWFFKKVIIEQIQTIHPLIHDLTIEHNAPGGVYVTIDFQQPVLLRQTPSAYFVSYNEDIYPVTQDSILTSGLMTIQLPKFSSGWTDINGIYRSIREEDLVKRLEQITTYLSGENITELIYQPGGKRLFVTYKGKRVYFNLQKDMLSQIDKLLALEEHRGGFDNVRTIDVGSREEAVVQ